MKLEKPCILSNIGVNTGGYSQVKIRGRLVLKHRIVLEETLGRPIKDGYFACHHCDIRNCIEPTHLFEGTASENTLDAFRKGRRKYNGNWNHHGNFRKVKANASQVR